MSENETEDAERAFASAVNMTADEMREWLDTEQSNEVGWTHEGEEEAVGHQSGRRILEILERGGGAAPRDEDEEKFQRRVAGYIHRHLAQRPDGDISETRWRYSLKNWGHDPLKDDATGASSEDRDEMPERADDDREDVRASADSEGPGEDVGAGTAREDADEELARRRSARTCAPSAASEARARTRTRNSARGRSARTRTLPRRRTAKTRARTRR